MFPSDTQPAPELLSPETEHVLDSAQAGARFIRGSVSRLIGYVVSVGMSVGATRLVIQHLGPPDYGTFVIVQTIVFIIGGFTEGGLNQLGIREYASGREDRDQVLRNLVGLRVTGTAVAVIVVAVVCVLVGTRALVVEGLLVAGGGLVLTILGENYGIALNAELRLTTVAVLGVIQQATLTGCYAVLVVLGARVLPLLGSTLASGGVLLIGTAVVLGRRVSLVPAFNPRVWLALLSETLPYAMATAVGILYFREALVLIGLFSTDVQASYYGAAFKVVDVLMIVPYQIVMMAFPILTRAAHTEDDSRLAYALQRLVDVGLLAGLFIAGAVWVGAPFGISVIAGGRFGPSVEVLRLQGTSLVATFIVATCISVMLSMRLYRQVLSTNLVAVLVATGLSVALIPGLGARGAAIAAASAEITLAASYCWVLVRTRPDLRVSFGLAPRAAVAVAVALAAALLPPLPSPVALVVFAVVDVAALALMRAIPFEVVHALMRRELTQES